VLFPASTPPERIVSFARTVEDLGFGELWIAEDCFQSAGPSLAALALASSTALRVGIGLMPATVRNPVFAAMEIATLARTHPGRLTVAFGRGVPEWMRRVGADQPAPLDALEETVCVVRRLLSGERVSVQGRYVRASNAKLAFAPAVIPTILIGSTGPRGLEIAGRVADGILLPEGSSPEFARWARARAACTPGVAGASQRGRGPICVTYCWLSIDHDGDAARARLAPTVRAWLSSGLFPAIQRHGGPCERFARGDVGVEHLTQRIAACGDPGACAAAVNRFRLLGAGRVVLAPRPVEPVRELALFAETVGMGRMT
jgi:alkanesulfonate monooxygenase SsuD/methylene tetrahydromethanopterin reductase-like flavin-dependent oxidoreductase (luciferase family)